jgi:hypothetical protein
MGPVRKYRYPIDYRTGHSNGGFEWLYFTVLFLLNTKAVAFFEWLDFTVLFILFVLNKQALNFCLRLL